MGARPGTVVAQRAAFERAEADVVQAGEDEPGDVAAGQGEIGGLLRSLELAGHAEIERRVREELAEPSRLRLSLGRQPAGDARVAVGQPSDRELALGMAC